MGASGQGYHWHHFPCTTHVHPQMDRMQRRSPSWSLGLLLHGLLLLVGGWCACAWAGPARAADLAQALSGPAAGTSSTGTGGGFDPLALVTGELGSPVSVRATIEPAAAGQPDVLAISATLEEGWHLYSITQKPGGPLATRIALAADSPRQAAGRFQPDVPPRSHPVDDIPAWKGLVVEEHEGTVTWRAPLAAGRGEVRGTVTVQLCREGACMPPETLEFVAVEGDAGGAARGSADSGSAAAVAQYVVAQHVVERSHATVVAGWQPPRGDRVPLRLTIEPDDHWHVYAPSGSAASGVGQGKPTIVAAESGRVVEVVATRVQPATTAELAEAGAVEGPVSLELLIDPAGGDSVDLLVGLQTCTDTTCDPPTAVRIKAQVPAAQALVDTVREAVDPPAIAFSAAKYAEAARQPLAIASSFATGSMATGSVSAADPPVGPLSLTGLPGPKALTLPVVLLMGLAGGLILNLMPCVLPVLGLKLMSFAQQSGRARREVFEMNLWYCAGLFAVFFVLATASVAANVGLGGSNLAWGEQFTNASFNIGMVAIVFAFALSFLGVWELPIPGFIGEQAGHVQTREGPLGAFLKGVLSTVLATPCSGPFLGPVFGFTLTQPTIVTYAVFAAIATGMSLPYILVGFFPGLVKFLPKPGAWMATFKELLGFVMLGTVVYLFTFLHHEWFVPTLALLVGIWAACWWVGRAQEKFGAGVGFGRWVQAAAFATAVGTAAFMYLGPVESLIEWERPFSRARLAELRQAGNTVMVDFSADWCPTCKFNLATAIETRRVKKLVEKNRVVPLLADWTDGSPEIKQMLESLESRSIPVLAIFPGGEPGQPLPEPIVLRDLLTESQVLEALERAGPSCCPPPEIRAASAGPTHAPTTVGR
jgi:suppressor for copper-sensitivity B